MATRYLFVLICGRFRNHRALPPLPSEKLLQCFFFWHLVQYCAKVTQAKCANFILCSCALSRKVRAKVRVTIQGLSSEISLEQRTIFLRTFSTKRNFSMTSAVSLIQCPKFHVEQTQQFLTRSTRSTRHITFAKDIQKVFNAPSN